MKRNIPLIALIFVLALPVASFAQTRGPRQSRFGTSGVQSLFSRGAGAGSASEAARAATEGQRFSRGARGPNEFVGSDRGDVTTFVGSEQGRTQGPVTSAVTGLREQTPPRVNQPRAAAASTGLNAPRIILSPELRLRSDRFARRESLAPQRRLGEFFAVRSGSQIVANGSGQNVTLTGRVATSREKRIAGLIASFEPGVRVVRNDLRVSQSDLFLPAPSSRSGR